MTDVRFPYMRREVINAIASVADRGYQERVWIRHEVPFDRYYDSLDEAIHWLFDDLGILPDPDDADGEVLLPGDDLDRLKLLGSVFHEVIDRLGAAPDADYLADPAWDQVAQRAAYCLPPMILSGGWEHADTESDAQTYAKQRADGRIPTVEQPATRRRVIRAVAALADKQYQQRTWTGDAGDGTTDSLRACLHLLTDEARVLPDPAAAIGRVLLPGDEIDRLRVLGDTLQAVGGPEPDEHDTPGWGAVVAAALNCLPALVIAGAWTGPNPA